MSFLTSRTLATGVTGTDLIHIVITGDTSQNPAGSSYKATIQQVFDAYEDVFVTGGTFNNSTDTITFTNNTGGTFTVTGLTDVFVTGGTFNNSTDTITFTNNTGGTFTVTGLTDVFVTGFTYNNANTITLSQNNGTSTGVTINIMTGLTVNGNLTVTGNTSLQGLTATTISATTYQNLPISGLTAGQNISISGTSGNLTISVTGLSGSSVISVTGVTTSAYTATTSYSYYGVEYSGNTNIEIPDATGLNGFTFRIKDERGTASTYPIIITPSSGNIDGNPSVTMSINYMSLTLIARNSAWWLI